MPSSSSSSYDSLILAEYSRRCWTATAKANKYLKIYALLQQATTTQQQLDAASSKEVAPQRKQVQFRHLMARVCLSKLACPVASSLHSLEATFGFLDAGVLPLAVQSFLDALASLKETQPKYGSIAKDIALLKKPIDVVGTDMSALIAASPSSGISPRGPQSMLVNPRTYDASATVGGFASSQQLEQERLTPTLFLPPSAAGQYHDKTLTTSSTHADPLAHVASLLPPHHMHMSSSATIGPRLVHHDSALRQDMFQNPSSTDPVTPVAAAPVQKQTLQAYFDHVAPTGPTHTLSTGTKKETDDFTCKYAWLILKVCTYLHELLRASEAMQQTYNPFQRISSGSTSAITSSSTSPVSTTRFNARRTSLPGANARAAAMLAKLDVNTIMMLQKATLETAAWLDTATIHRPLERRFDHISEALRRVLADEAEQQQQLLENAQLSFASTPSSRLISSNATSMSSVTHNSSANPLLTRTPSLPLPSDPLASLSRVTALVRVQLACNIINEWLAKEETQNQNNVIQGITSMQTVRISNVAPPIPIVLTFNSTVELSNAATLLEQAVDDARAWSDSSSDVAGFSAPRCATLLLAHLLRAIAHSRERMLMSYEEMMLHDRSQSAVDPATRDRTSYVVYCPRSVRKFISVLTNTPASATSSSSSSSSSSASGSASFAGFSPLRIAVSPYVALLRQCLSFIQLSSSILQQLNDMVGLDPTAPLPTLNANGTTNPPSSTATSSPQQNHPAASRIRIARRQYRLVLRNGYLDEFDACVRLYHAEMIQRVNTSHQIDVQTQQLIHTMLQSIKTELQRQSEREV